MPLSDGVPQAHASYIHRDTDSESNEVSDAESLNDRSRLITAGLVPTLSIRYFEYRHARYIWSSREGSYVRLYGLDKGHPISRFTADYIQGITKEEQIGRRTVHGCNSVDVEVKGYATLFVQEVFISILFLAKYYFNDNK